MNKFSATALNLLEELIDDEYIESIDEASEKFIELNPLNALRIFINEEQHSDFINLDGSVNKSKLIEEIGECYFVVVEGDCIVVEL